jgi:hypothetical protein
VLTLRVIAARLVPALMTGPTFTVPFYIANGGMWGFQQADGYGWLGIFIVVTLISLSIYCFEAVPDEGAPDEPDNETRMLRQIRVLTTRLALRAFPIGIFRNRPQFAQLAEPQRELARDNAVDNYVLAWTIGLLVVWDVVVVGELSTKSTPGILFVIAWVAAYRVVDIAIGRLHILTNYAGRPPFSMFRARRSLLGSLIVLGQIILAFALMYAAWTGGASSQWDGGAHSLLSFTYISTRVIFTLGPPYNTTGQLSATLVSAELLAGLLVIGLGIAQYIGSLSGAGTATSATTPNESSKPSNPGPTGV